jgi:hypothetical protein
VRYLLLAGIALAPMLAQAQPTPVATPAASTAPAKSGDAVKAVAQAALDAKEVDVSQNIEDQINTYLEKSGLRARQLRHELEILKGVSAVLVSSTSRDWVMQRSAAYDNALLQAEADYVMQQGLQITDQTSARFFHAADQGPPPYDSGREPGKQAELVRKVVALASGKLDGELRNLGIDPKEYGEAPQPQRYLQMQSALKRETARRAMGELTGLVPVQTFEGHDGRGNYTVGVVAVVSPAMKELAREVLTAHGEIQADPTRAQDLTQLYANRTELVRDFGVRRMFDGAGSPVLISFAQWASDYAGSDPAVAQEYRGMAIEQATATADGQIAQFLSGSMMVDSNSQTGRDLEKQAEQLPDGYAQDDAATKTVTSGLLKTMRSRANVQVTDIQTFYTWSGKHPDTGQQIVGVIRMWSAAGEKATRALRDQHGPATTPTAAAEQPHGMPSVQQGRDLMKASDF